jgi:hypothetical protein
MNVKLENISMNYKSSIFKKMMIQKELLEQFGNEDKIILLYEKTIVDNLDDDIFMEDYYKLCFDNNLLLFEDNQQKVDQQKDDQPEDANVMKKDIEVIKKYLQQQQIDKFHQQKKAEEIHNQNTSPKSTIIKTAATLITSGFSMWLFNGGLNKFGSSKTESEIITEIDGTTLDGTPITGISVNPQAVTMAKTLFSGLLSLLTRMGSPLGIATTIGLAALVWGSLAVAKAYPIIRNNQDKLKAHIVKLNFAIKKGDELVQRSNHRKVIKRWSTRRMRLMKKLTLLKMKLSKTIK